MCKNFLITSTYLWISALPILSLGVAMPANATKEYDLFIDYCKAQMEARKAPAERRAVFQFFHRNPTRGYPCNGSRDGPPMLVGATARYHIEEQSGPGVWRKIGERDIEFRWIKQEDEFKRTRERGPELDELLREVNGPRAHALARAEEERQKLDTYRKLKKQYPRPSSPKMTSEEEAYARFPYKF